MIRIDHLNFTISKKKILKDINLLFEEGSFTALMGPNGSGKTTLLKCMVGLNTITSGEIWLNGQLQKKYTAKQFSHQLAYLPQERYMLFNLKAYDMVMMGRYPYQKPLEAATEYDEKVVEESMIKTDTWHLKEQNVQFLSGGEFQRLSIAQALAQQTPILLLDEPLSSLDLRHQKDMMELLQSVNKNDHKTIVIIVHDLNTALKYCPQAVLIKAGQVISQGTTETVLAPAPIQAVFDLETEIFNTASGKFLAVKS